MDKINNILRYAQVEVKRAKIKKYYLEWRKRKGIPYKCDIGNCVMNTPNPEWNNAKITLIMDHKEGNKFDNRPEMLQLVCPNCDSQLPTKGGKNRGRLLSRHENGFSLKNFSGGISYNHFGSGGVKFGCAAIVTFVKGNS